MSTKHSPLPWKVNSKGPALLIRDATGGRVVADCLSGQAINNEVLAIDAANRDLILAACNNYSAVVAENKRLREAAEGVQLKCQQYWNEHNISDAEIHAVLEYIFRETMCAIATAPRSGEEGAGR